MERKAKRARLLWLLPFAVRCCFERIRSVAHIPGRGDSFTLSIPLQMAASDKAFVFETVELEEDDGAALKFEEVPHFEDDDPDDFSKVFSSLQPGASAGAGSDLEKKQPIGPALAPERGSGAAGAGGSATSSGLQPDGAATTMSVEDFVRNFLVANDMKRTLDAFQAEWFQNQRGGTGSGAKAALPQVYQQFEALQRENIVLKQTVSTAQGAATEAQNTWAKYRRERDVHRMHHRRLVQEKNDLVTDLQRLKAHVLEYQPVLEALQHKYEQAMKERMLAKLERSKLLEANARLQSQLAAAGLAAPPAGRAASSSSSSSSSSSVAASSTLSRTSLAGGRGPKTSGTAAAAGAKAAGASPSSAATLGKTQAGAGAAGKDKGLVVNERESWAHLLSAEPNPYAQGGAPMVPLASSVLAHSFKAHK